MSVTAGALSKVSIGVATASLLSAAATGGTSPYTYQWYMSTISGFTPGAGSLVAGATALSQSFSGLAPGVTYFFKVVATDVGASNATSISAQLTVITAPAQSQNQFLQTPVIGMPDQKMNYNTTPVMIDASEVSLTDQAGTAVKIVASSTGVPKVIACTANSDVCHGFLQYDVKSAVFLPMDMAEMCQSGDALYLISVGAIDAGTEVQLDLTYVGGVKAKTGSSGARKVGWSMDQATADGQLIRVKLETPSATTF